MADWEIICAIAQRMGFDGFDFSSAAEVFEEIQLFANPQTGYDLRGMSYSRLRENSLIWPCPDVQSAGLEKRYGSGESLRFPTESGRAQFIQTPYEPDARQASSGTLILNTGRYPHQWHTLTKTGTVPQLNQLNGTPRLEVHPVDAESMAIEAGAEVTVTSPNGEFTLTVDVTDRVSPGQCYAPMHWNQLHGNGTSVNAATLEDADPVSLQPALKSAPVTLARSVPHAPSAGDTSHFEAAYDDGFAMGQQSLSFFRQKRSFLAIARPVSRSVSSTQKML